MVVQQPLLTLSECTDASLGQNIEHVSQAPHPSTSALAHSSAVHNSILVRQKGGAAVN